MIPLKDNKVTTIDSEFFLNDSERKPNKIWVDQSSEFYNRSFKQWLDDNDIEIYLTHHERKSIVAQRLIGTLKNKIYKHMKAVSKKCSF